MARKLGAGIRCRNIVCQIKKLMAYGAHRRLPLFWVVALVALTGPWLLPAMSDADGQDIRENCQVLSIYDGDTMTVHCQGEKIKVRLYCIDAPEMRQEPWGMEARDTLQDLVGLTVNVRGRDRDRYGRIVGGVWSAGMNLNLEMVRLGRAAVYPRYCRDRSYYKAGRIAMDSRIGIWSVSGLHQSPWIWRKQQK